MTDGLDAPITLDQLKVFLCVVEEGSFSGAARRLRRVQSAISYSVANLERLLDVELFDRSGRTPMLTDAGTALLSDVRGVCERVDRLHARARSIARGVEPRVSVAVDMLYPMPSLLEALREFSARNPNVALHLRTEALGAVMQLVLDGTCQIGISIEHPEFPRELSVRPVAAIEMVPVCGRDHPLAVPAAPSAEDVRDAVQIVVTDRSELTAGQDRAVYSDRTWRVADLDAKRDFIVAGFGWGMLPAHLIAGDLATGALRALDLAAWAGGVPGALRLYGIFRTADPPGPAASWLLDRLARS